MPFTAGKPLADAKAGLFKALAHPARIRVLELLAGGEHTIGELAELTGLELSHLSQQVAVLRRASIVDSRRVKSTVICSLRDPRTAQLLAVARELLSNNLRQSHALLVELDSAEDAVALSSAGPTKRGKGRMTP